ncbi:MAG TPA: M48 family metallopeptidase [Thermoanaerobaculia bacterium]|nr:M48 family metallopeptidase [Thermoanaerobaculia bacterium]
MRIAAITIRLLLVAFAALAQQERPRDPRFEIEVTEEMIRHSRILDALYFGGFVYGLAVLVIVLATRISSRLRDAATRVTGRPFLMSLIYVSLFTLVTALMEFPLSYYAGFVRPHQFSLSNQTFAAWLADHAKGLGVSLVLGSFAGALALLAIRRLRRWWLAIWLGMIPLTILLVVIAPVFIDPLFNRFEPLKDQVLKQRLLDMADRAGIEGGRVYQVDKSKQTKTLNAYVTGIGPTKRIVMWDTLLNRMTADEVVAVMGHEMGHYVLHHLWKGLAATLALAFGILFLAQRVFERGVVRWGGRWGLRGHDDAAALPWLLIIVSVISFMLSPVINGYSRHIEHEADVFGLELTHLNEPMATAFIKLAENAKVNPRPHPLIEFWRYSHPSIANRIEFVLGYRPWERQTADFTPAGPYRAAAPRAARTWPRRTSTEDRDPPPAHR